MPLNGGGASLVGWVRARSGEMETSLAEMVNQDSNSLDRSEQSDKQ
jgi:hypothetical protein